MDIKRLALDFVSSFLLTLVVASVVTYLWNLAFEGAGAVEWKTSFRLAFIFGFVLPWMAARWRQQKPE